MSAKTATILTRTEPQTKEAADAIFARLGLTTSGAINIFLHQSIETQGMPFQARLMRPSIPDLSMVSDEEAKDLIKQGLEDIDRGRTKPVREAFAELKEKHEF